MKQKNIILLLSSMLLAEIVFHINLQFGFIIYACFLAVTLFLLSREHYDSDFRLISVVLILPILRMSEVFLDLGKLWNTAVFYAIFLLLIIFYTNKLNISINYGIRGIKFLPLSILLGAILGLGGHYILNLTSSFGLVYIFSLIAVSEELFFRGMIQKMVSEHYSPFFGIVFASLLYAVFAFSYGIRYNIIFLAYNLGVGLLYYRSQNIYVAMAANLSLSLFMLGF